MQTKASKSKNKNSCKMEKTSIFFLKEDNLNFFENVRRPQQNNATKNN